MLRLDEKKIIIVKQKINNFIYIRFFVDTLLMLMMRYNKRQKYLKNRINLILINFRKIYLTGCF